jgi:hypothetical protein
MEPKEIGLQVCRCGETLAIYHEWPDGRKTSVHLGAHVCIWESYEKEENRQN